MTKVLKIVLPVLVLVALLAVGFVPASEVDAQRNVPGYIVVLKDGSFTGMTASNRAMAVNQSAGRLATRYGLTVFEQYSYSIRGFAANIPANKLAALRNDPSVAYVEPNQVFSIQAQTVPTGLRRSFASTNPNLDIDGVDDFRVNVDVAVIDSGIAAHADLNLVGHVNCAGGSPTSKRCSSGGTDGNGHGTHVAGTIGALDNGIGVVGVAPGARLWGVRVLSNSGSGYTNWIIAGIEWVTANAATIEVANMSLGCDYCSSAAQNTAIANSVNAGVVYVVAAGNSDINAANSSPANHPDVLTVSALADFNGLAGGGGASTCRADEDDTLANFSNWGSTVEIAAPGVCINSTWLNGGYNTISGTSMASPHAAGAAALLASVNNPNNKTAVFNIYAQLRNTGNYNWTDDSGDGVKEPLLDVTTFSANLIAR